MSSAHHHSFFLFALPPGRAFEQAKCPDQVSSARAEMISDPIGGNGENQVRLICTNETKDIGIWA